MCALRAAHKISMFSKMCAMRYINAQNGHFAQLKSEGEANAQNKMCKNRSSFWAPWVMQILESVFISIAAILWKENIHRFCRSESIPNVIQRFGSFLVSFLRNANPGEWFISTAVRWKENIRRFCQPRFQISWKNWIPSETFIFKHVELHFKLCHH